MFQEIELKLRLTPQQKSRVIKKLHQLGAQTHPLRHQQDTLFNCRHIDFKKHDQSLRLRIETIGNKKSATLTFKGTPRHTPHGHKIRDEFNTLADPQTTPKLLQAIGFYPVTTIKKTRTLFTLGKLEIALDQLKFGIFLELEGSPEDIQKTRHLLGLEDPPPIKLGYGKLQLAWEQDHIHKPRYLYHGSPRKLTGKQLLPQRGFDLDNQPENLRHAVYATTSKNAAIAMAIIKSPGVISSSLHFDQHPPAIIYQGHPCQDSIYLFTLPPKTFIPAGEGGYQWSSPKPVTPLKAEKLSLTKHLNLVRFATKKETKQFNQKYQIKTR